MNKFYKRVVIDNLDEFNSLIVKAKKFTKLHVISYLKREQCEVRSFMQDSVLKIDKAKATLTTKMSNIDACPIDFIFYLNDDPSRADKTGLDCYREMQRCAKLPKIADIAELAKLIPFSKSENKYLYSAKPYIGYNEKQQGSQELVYEYDINSAYSSIIVREGIPNVFQYRFNDIVNEGEIGFQLLVDLPIVPVGRKADIVMPLVKNEGLEKFCRRWYERKKNAPKGSKERNNCKLVMNAAIGYLQKTNPFVRSYIVNRCNQIIRELKDKDVILWNTDAIYSLSPRPELDIGSDIGQFKEDVLHDFYYIKDQYQVGDDVPVLRGTPKAWFKAFEIIYGRKWMLRSDGPVPAVNEYYYDENERIFKRTLWQRKEDLQ